MQQSNTAAEEKAVLGGILIDCRRAFADLSGLKPEHFSSPELGRLYAEAVELFSGKKEADFLLLAERAASVPELSLAPEQAKELLLSCMEGCVSLTNLPVYADMIRAGWKRRQLDRIAAEIQATPTSRETVDGCIQGAGERLFALLQAEESRSLTPASKTLADHYLEMFDQKSLARRAEFGIPQLDGLLGGVDPTDFCILAARPAVGKTAFAANLLLHMAQKGRKTAFFSLEMSGQQVVERWLSMLCGIPQGAFRAKALAQYGAELNRGMAALSGLPIYIDDTASQTVQEIRNKCRMHPDLGAVVIDYVGLIQPRRGVRYINRAEAIGQISRDLKIMAKELRVPLIVLSQLNRVTEDTKEPGMSELRESGSLEQDADQIILLWRHKPEENLIGCKVAKNRHGRTGTAVLRFDPQQMRFSGTDIAYRREQPKVPWDA